MVDTITKYHKLLTMLLSIVAAFSASWVYVDQLTTHKLDELISESRAIKELDSTLLMISNNLQQNQYFDDIGEAANIVTQARKFQKDDRNARPEQLSTLSKQCSKEVHKNNKITNHYCKTIDEMYVNSNF